MQIKKNLITKTFLDDGPASNVRFVFKTFDSNGRRGIEEVTVYASGTTTPFPVTTGFG